MTLLGAQQKHAISPMDFRLLPQNCHSCDRLRRQGLPLFGHSPQRVQRFSGSSGNRHSSELSDCHPLAFWRCAARRNTWLSSTCRVLDSQNLLLGRPLAGGLCWALGWRASTSSAVARSSQVFEGNKRRREKREGTISSDWRCAPSKSEDHRSETPTAAGALAVAGDPEQRLRTSCLVRI